MEPVAENSDLMSEQVVISAGRTSSVATIQKPKKWVWILFASRAIQELGSPMKYLSSKTAKEHFSGLIIAGKMHSAGSSEPGDQSD